MAAAAAPHGHASPALTGVVGFDLYRDGTILHLLTAEFGGARNERALLHRRSDDGGTRWSDPVRVAAPGAAIHDIVRGNDPQIAARGRDLVAVWTTPGSGYGGSGPLATAVSRDGGRSWRRGPNPADDGTTAGHAYVDVVAGAGGLDLVWLDGRDGAQGLRHARSTDSGASWSGNATVQKATCECCWNTLSRRGDSVYAMVRGKGPRDMLLYRRAGESAWGLRSTVGAFNWDYKGCPHTGGGLAWSGAVGAGETLHAVVWTGAQAEEGLHYLRSVDRGRTWSPPHRVGSRDARLADVAAHDDGHVLIAWDQMDGERRAIYAMRSRTDGRHWLKPERLSDPKRDAVYPRVVEAGDDFLVAWTQSDGAQARRLEMRRVGRP